MMKYLILMVTIIIITTATTSTTIFSQNYGPDQLPKPPPSPTNFFRATTPSNQVFPPQPPPTINQSSQINDFSTLSPEILKFELRKISKPKMHQTTQTLSGKN